MDKVKMYKAAAQRWAAMYKVDEQHAIDVAASVLMTRDGVLQGGSFVQAIIDNNLREAINRADDVCIKYLKFFVVINHNCGSYEIENGIL
jgi:hypothetical protein